MYIKVDETQLKNIISFVANSVPRQPIGQIVPEYLAILEILNNPIDDKLVTIKEQNNESQSISSKTNK